MQQNSWQLPPDFLRTIEELQRTVQLAYEQSKPQANAIRNAMQIVNQARADYAAVADIASSKAALALVDVSEQIMRIAPLLAERNRQNFEAIRGFGAFLNTHERYYDSLTLTPDRREVLEFLPELEQPQVALVAELEAKSFVAQVDVSITKDNGLVIPQDSYPRLLEISYNISMKVGDFERKYPFQIAILKVFLLYLGLRHVEPGVHWSDAVNNMAVFYVLNTPIADTTSPQD